MSVPLRRSPVDFDAVPAEVERRHGWDVVLAYEEDLAAEQARTASRLVDLSHRRRWDYQDRGIDGRRPFGLEVPDAPGRVRISHGLMINRMNRTQAAIWHVGPQQLPPEPHDIGLTETTDAQCWLAIVGPSVPSVMEHVTSLDLFPPHRPPPFLTQGPVFRVTCQLVTWAEDLVLIALSRGYGQSFVDALFESAAPAGLVPGGERIFTDRVPRPDR